MTIEEIIQLLPCHTLDDFPYYYEGVEADNVLAGYSAMWHPELIAHTGKTPRWQTSYHDDASQLANRLVILSKVAQDDLPGFWVDQAAESGATIIAASDALSRDEIATAALAKLRESKAVESEGGGDIPPPGDLDPELVQDFLALGLCHLLSELLTTQMRYASLIDQEHFESQLVEAATAAMKGDGDAAREKLQACFDALAQSRDHYYPVDGYILNLTLVAPTTIGKALRDELASDTAQNLLISAATLEEMQAKEPETVTALRDAIDRGTVCLVGGDADNGDAGNGEFALLDNEAMLASLRKGAATFESVLGQPPKVFGRREFGLTPTLPGLLNKLGYVGVVHFTIDGGRFAEPLQSKTLWEGIDGETLDAYARLPLDASRSDSFLCFSQRMGESMDADHVAVVCYAHWPGQTSPWYDDLKRIASFGTVLGKFVTLEHFLQETDTPRDHARYTVDDYRSPYLRQAATTERLDPISASVSRARTSAERESAAALGTMTAMLTRTAPTKNKPGATTEQAASDFASALAADNGIASGGYLVTNPLSSARRVAVEVPRMPNPPTVGGQVEAAYRQGDDQEVLVEVPAQGYLWLTPDADASWQKPRGKLLAEDNIIRNEHAEVTVNRETGAVRSVRCPGIRGNLLSQQLAMRTPDPTGGNLWGNDKADYSVMVAEAVEVNSAGPVSASITSRGRLVNRNGKPLANFEQTISLIRNRPVLDFNIRLEPLVPAGTTFTEAGEPIEVSSADADPWNAYFASRLAWADPSAELFRSVARGAHPTELRRLEATDYVEIRAARFRTSLLTGGLPYHRRTDDRTLDTILITGNEQARRFRFGIGLNLNQPHHAARELITPPQVQYLEPQAAPATAAGWLFHINAKNVAATHWEPIVAAAPDAHAQSAVTGVRVRLLEATGRSTSCDLRSIYPVARARRVDFQGQLLAELPTEDDRVMIELHPHQWCEVEIDWQS